MKIDLSAGLLTIRGEQMKAEDTGEPISIGQALANQLLATEQAEPVKVFDWCRKVCDGLKVSVLLKGQVIEALMDQMQAE